MEAFLDLYPEKVPEHTFSLGYSGKFRGYNANVKMRGKKMMFWLSRKWKTIQPEIQMGIIQELMVRIFKDKRNTTGMDLYHTFLKNIHMVIPKTKSDPLLEASFVRINEKYFFGMLEQPNLAWGTASFRKLGSYEYGTDTITLSRILSEDPELVDYVMHHEMLHKKLQYKAKNGRSLHHSSEFRRLEKRFENSALLEKRLQNLGRKRKRGFFNGLFGSPGVD